ncbi:MAG: M48 family metalloprotease [Candidatus Saccharimonas sp.]
MYKAIERNKRNTIVLMIVFVAMVAAVGLAVQAIMDSEYGTGSLTIFWGTFVGALVYAIFQYFMASKLAMSMTGATPIKKADNQRLWRTVENLAITTGLPMPEVYIISDSAPNAFATGRDPKHAIVGVTTGLLDIMNDRELTAVLAHEMGHVQNYDIRVSMITFGLVSAIGLISDIALRMLWYGGNNDRRDTNPIVLLLGIIAIILAPIVSSIMQMAVSRQREYLADATGAMTTRDPEGLASALGKLKRYTKPMKKQVSSSANMFMVNPLRSGFFTRLFSTHPPLDDRIKRLQEDMNKWS